MSALREVSVQARGSRPDVLVVPRDAVIGALMAELLRFAGYRPVFLGADESPARGIMRVVPPLVFIDCDHPAAFSVELKGSLTESGARLMLYSGSRTERDLLQTAHRHGADAFVLPNGPRALQRTIEAVLEKTEPPRATESSPNLTAPARS